MVIRGFTNVIKIIRKTMASIMNIIMKLININVFNVIYIHLWLYRDLQIIFVNY